MLISVVLPTYNGLPYVKDSIQSVINQTFKNFEFLICDDASTDGTWEYLNSIKDSRIKLYRNNYNKGLYPTLNFLIKQAQGQWIYLWSQDDIMYPNCLEEVANFINKHPYVPFFFVQRDIIDEKGKIIYKFNKNWKNELISVEHLIKVSILAGSITGNISTTVIKKAEIEAIGYFDETMKYSADFDMWERLSRNHKYIGVINKPLIQLRVHNNQLSKQHKAKIYQLRENKIILQRWLERLKQIADQKTYKKAIRGINWKIKTMFFAFGIKMLVNKNFNEAKKFFKELNNWEPIIYIAIRYFIVKILSLLKLKNFWFKLLFYNNYY